MSFFTQSLSGFMTRDPRAVAVDAPLDEVVQLLQQRTFSAVPVVDRNNAPVGLISRVDLIHLGLLNTGTRPTSPSMAMPARTAAEVMTTGPLMVEPSTSLAAAGATMHEHGIHRLIVVSGGRLVGILSTLDLAAAVRDARVGSQVSEWMTQPIVSIEATRPLSEADAALEQHHVSAIVVTEDAWPIGVFAQVDAIAHRDLPRSTPVETVLDPAMICLPFTTKIFRAAAHAAQLDVRRVIVCEGRTAIGVLGGLDFARVVAKA